MSEPGGFFTYTRDEFVDEFVHPDDRVAVQEARDKRALKVRAEYLTEMRKKAGLTQTEVAEAMGISQQRVSAIENGTVAVLVLCKSVCFSFGSFDAGGDLLGVLGPGDGGGVVVPAAHEGAAEVVELP